MSKLWWGLGAVVVGGLVGLFLWLDAGADADGRDGAAELVAEGETAGEVGGFQAPRAGAGSQAQRLPVDESPAEAGDQTHPAAGSQPPTPPAAVLEGWVVDAAARPVADAAVHYVAEAMPQIRRLTHYLSPGLDGVQAGMDDLPTTRTDADGRFQLELTVDHDEASSAGVLVTRPKLLVRHPAYRTAARAAPPLAPGNVRVGTITLEPGARLAGRIVDGQGHPVPGAQVLVNSTHQVGSDVFESLVESMVGSVEDLFAEVTSDESGRFELWGLPPGAARLSVLALGFAPAQRTGIVLDTELPLDVGDLALSAGRAIGGRLVDRQGQPIARGAVTVEGGPEPEAIGSLEDASTYMFHQLAGRSCVTDEQGHFAVHGLEPGVYALKATADGWNPTTFADIAAGSEELELALERLGRLLLAVHGPEGDRLSGAGVRAWRLDESLEDQDELTVTEEQDGYHVAGAGPHGTRLLVVAEGCAARRLTGQPVPFDEQRLQRVDLSPEAVLVGRVLDPDGQGVAGARVQLMSELPEQEAGWQESLKKVAARDADEAADEVPAQVGPLVATAQSAEDGSFRLRALEQVEGWLLAQAADHLPSQPVEVPPGARPQDEFVLVVTPAGSLSGVVTEADGRPASDATVRVAPHEGAVAAGLEEQLGQALILMMTGESGDARRVRSDMTGRFLVRGLAPGLWEVTLERPQALPLPSGLSLPGMPATEPEHDDGQRTHLVEVLPGQQTEVSFVREARAQIGGRVLAHGQPAGNVEVQLMDRATKVFGIELPLPSRSTRTDARGGYRFALLEPGAYRVVGVMDAASAERSQDVDLAPGDDRLVDLAFDGATLSGRVIALADGRGLAGLIVKLIPLEGEGSGPEDDGGGLNFSFTVQVNDAEQSTDMKSGSREQASSAADGTFQLPFVDPGRYAVEAAGGPWIPGRTEPFVVEANEVIAGLELALERGSLLSGRVRSGSTGRLLDDDVQVQLLGPDGKRRDKARTEDGMYRFNGLGPGEYTLVIAGKGLFAGDRARRTVSVEPGGQPLLVDLVTDD